MERRSNGNHYEKSSPCRLGLRPEPGSPTTGSTEHASVFSAKSGRLQCAEYPSIAAVLDVNGCWRDVGLALVFYSSKEIVTLELSHNEAQSLMQEAVAVLLDLKEDEIESEFVDERKRQDFLSIVEKLGGHIDWETLDPDEFQREA